MRLGYHVGKGDSKSETPYADALRMAERHLRDLGVRHPAAQIFVSGPQSSKPLLTAGDRQAVREVCESLPVVVHGSYIDNPWNLLPGTVENILSEMSVSGEIGAEGVIVHLGKAAAGPNLETVLSKIYRAESPVLKSRLWLEINCARSGSDTFETPEKLTRLFSRVGECCPELDIGLCIDSAHLYSCGVSLNSRAAAERWLGGLPEVPVMIHLNDSTSVRGSGRDRHAPLMRGGIWGDYSATGTKPPGDSGLCALLEYAERENSLVILERTPADIDQDLSLLGQLGYL